MAGERLARLRAVDPAAVAALLAGLAAVAVIRTTLLPTVGTWDTAEAQVVPPLMGTMHPTGFPAYVLAGWLVSVLLQPLGSPAFVMNLMSALLVGFAVGGSVLVARRLGAPLPVALAVAAGFTLTPAVWRIGNAADVHALHLALLVVVVLALLRWEALVARRNGSAGDPALARRADRGIIATAVLFGVALANHALTLLLIPAVGVFVLAVDPRVVRRRRTVVAVLGACLGVAAALYLELPLRAGVLRAPLVYGEPDTLLGFLQVALGTQFAGDIANPAANLGDRGAELVAIATAQFGPLVALIPAGLLLTIIRFPRYALLSLVATGLTCLFAASYENARIDRYYLGPIFFAWTWIAVFAGSIARGAIGRAGPEPADGLEPEPPDAWVPAWLEPRTVLAIALGIALLVPTGTELAGRWRDLDRSRETWVDAWLTETFTALDRDAVVISWWTYSTPLWYAQLVEGRRPDVWVVDDRTRLDLRLGSVEDVIEANLGTRPVYLIRVKESDVKILSGRYAIEPVDPPGNLFHVTGRQGNTQ